MGFETDKEHTGQPTEEVTKEQPSRTEEAEERFVDYIRQMCDPDKQGLRDDYRRKAVVEGIHIVTTGSPDKESHPISRVSRQVGEETARDILSSSVQEYLRRRKSVDSTPKTAERPLPIVDFQRQPEGPTKK